MKCYSFYLFFGLVILVSCSKESRHGTSQIADQDVNATPTMESVRDSMIGSYTGTGSCQYPKETAGKTGSEISAGNASDEIFLRIPGNAVVRCIIQPDMSFAYDTTMSFYSIPAQAVVYGRIYGSGDMGYSNTNGVSEKNYLRYSFTIITETDSSSCSFGGRRR